MSMNSKIKTGDIGKERRKSIMGKRQHKEREQEEVGV